MKATVAILPLSGAAALLLGVAGSVGAAGFTPPAGCTTFLTVQMKSCEVSVFWRCGGQQGHVWEGSYDGDGPRSVTLYDREFQWLDSFYAFDGTREQLSDPGKDPISMSDLLDKGEDTFGFTLESSDGDTSHKLYVEGRDKLTGAVTVIDGVSLLDVDTRLTIRTEDGGIDYATTGRQYVAPEMRLFLLGQEQVTQDGESQAYDNTPIDFIFPGEPGFNMTRPLYECESVTSGIGFTDVPAKG